MSPITVLVGCFGLHPRLVSLIVLGHKVDGHQPVYVSVGLVSLRSVFAPHSVVEFFDAFGYSDGIEGHLSVGLLQIRIADLLVFICRRLTGRASLTFDHPAIRRIRLRLRQLI